MKISELKAALRGCYVDVHISCRYQGTFEAVLEIRRATDSMEKYDWSAKDLFLAIRFQANDTFAASMGNEPEYTRGFRRLPGVGYFYAGRIETEHCPLWNHVEAAKGPDRAESFCKLIRQVVEDKNLGYKHPQCELTQTLAALYLLGTTEGEWSYWTAQGGRVSLREWIAEREKMRPAQAQDSGEQAS